MGAWFEAQILNVTKSPKPAEGEGMETDGEDDICYHIKYEEWVYSLHISTTLCGYHTKMENCKQVELFTDRFEEFTNKMAVEGFFFLDSLGWSSEGSCLVVYCDKYMEIHCYFA